MFDQPSALDRLVLRVLSLVIPVAPTRTKAWFDSDNPAQLTPAYTALAAAWILVYMLVSLVWLGTWAALRGLDVVPHLALIPVLEFIFGFCLVGALDAQWRCVFVWRAERRYLRAGQPPDPRSIRLVARSRRRVGTVLFQLAGGLMLATELVTMGEVIAGAVALVVVVGLIQLAG